MTITEIETIDKALSKLHRWVEKRERFSRQQAWQGTKGGAMRTTDDLDVSLAALTEQGIIAAEPVAEGKRVAWYVVGPFDGITTPAPTPPDTAHGNASAATQIVLPLPPPTPPAMDPDDEILRIVRAIPFGHPLGQAAQTILNAAINRHGSIGKSELRPHHFTPQQMVDLRSLAAPKPRPSNDEILMLGARCRMTQGRIDYLLGQIENRHHQKRAGDTLKGSDLNEYDRIEMQEICKCLGV
jgi:hypothetical protein